MLPKSKALETILVKKRKLIMTIKQIYDETLAQGSYAVESDGEVALIDPGRDTQPYLDFANENNAKIIAVFETHPHADFVSSHLEFYEKHKARIYVNPLVGVSYDHQPMEHNDEVKIGEGITFRALFTPGHSPDHNSYLLIDKSGKEKAVFTGDSLFVGDVGRPDLREGAGNLQVEKKELAAMMYDTINNVFKNIEDDVLVYPAHGAGSLCGKNMSDDLYSTIGREKKENWAFNEQDKGTFINNYLDGQPFIPKYFPFDVEKNREGAPALSDSLSKVTILPEGSLVEDTVLNIDVRGQGSFKKDHINGAINIQLGETNKYETWLGSIISPDESFNIIASGEAELKEAIKRTAKIGYETNILAAVVNPTGNFVSENILDLQDFKKNPDNYTIVDIRNNSETIDDPKFKKAVNIPLPELRDKVSDIDYSKPVVVHCAGGYRSAAGASIISKYNNAQVYDLSESVKDFQASS